LDKLQKTNIVPKYVIRDEQDLSHLTDFDELFTPITVFFAYLVIFARVFENFKTNQYLVDQYLLNSGLYTCGDEELDELLYMISNQLRIRAQRGGLEMIHISKYDVGIEWNYLVSPLDKSWTDVVYGNNMILLLSGGSAGVVAKSIDDGGTWTIHNTASNAAFSSITYSKSLNRFVAVASGGLSGIKIMWSDNGENWAGVSSAAYRKVIWVEDWGLFIAVGSNTIATLIASASTALGRFSTPCLNRRFFSAAHVYRALSRRCRWVDTAVVHIHSTLTRSGVLERCARGAAAVDARQHADPHGGTGARIPGNLSARPRR
jgi:hypothetical protein